MSNTPTPFISCTQKHLLSAFTPAPETELNPLVGADTTIPKPNEPLASMILNGARQDLRILGLGRLLVMAIQTSWMAHEQPVSNVECRLRSSCGRDVLCRGYLWRSRYRGPDGKCVSWEALGRVCGSPPTTRCAPERTAPAAPEAARKGNDIQKDKELQHENIQRRGTPN